MKNKIYQLRFTEKKFYNHFYSVIGYINDDNPASSESINTNITNMIDGKNTVATIANNLLAIHPQFIYDTLFDYVCEYIEVLRCTQLCYEIL